MKVASETRLFLPERVQQVQESVCPWKGSSRLSAPSRATSKPQKTQSKFMRNLSDTESLGTLVPWASWEPLSCLLHDFYFYFFTFLHNASVSWALLLHSLLCSLICYSSDQAGNWKKLAGEFGIEQRHVLLSRLSIIPSSGTASLSADNICAFASSSLFAPAPLSQQIRISEFGHLKLS